MLVVDFGYECQRVLHSLELISYIVICFISHFSVSLCAYTDFASNPLCRIGGLYGILCFSFKINFDSLTYG